MSHKSHSLFHFTRNTETLKSILKNGFWPKYSLEDVGWAGFGDVSFVAFPMVCFCDIPLSAVEDHVAFYGKFGLGLTKDWALSNGLTPIHYVSPTSEISAKYRHLADMTANNKDQKESSWKSLRFLLAHTKPLEGKVLTDSDFIDKDFHEESEWRYIATRDDIKDHLPKIEFEDKETKGNENAKLREHCMLKFTPNEVRYIFVPSEADIPDIINFIQTELDDYPSAQVKVLMSKVTSLETIRRDV